MLEAQKRRIENPPARFVQVTNLAAPTGRGFILVDFAKKQTIYFVHVK
jgi:hypothetical protein